MPENPYQPPKEVGTELRRRSFAIPAWAEWLVIALIVAVLVVWWLASQPEYPPGYRE